MYFNRLKIKHGQQYQPTNCLLNLNLDGAENKQFSKQSQYKEMKQKTSNLHGACWSGKYTQMCHTALSDTNFHSITSNESENGTTRHQNWKTRSLKVSTVTGVDAQLVPTDAEQSWCSQHRMDNKLFTTKNQSGEEQKLTGKRKRQSRLINNICKLGEADNTHAGTPNTAIDKSIWNHNTGPPHHAKLSGTTYLEAGNDPVHIHGRRFHAVGHVQVILGVVFVVHPIDTGNGVVLSSHGEVSAKRGQATRVVGGQYTHWGDCHCMEQIVQAWPQSTVDSKVYNKDCKWSMWSQVSQPFSGVQCSACSQLPACLVGNRLTQILFNFFFFGHSRSS